MELPVQHLQKGKLGVHAGQAVLIFLSWIIEIIVFRTATKIDGRPGWYFGLCFLTIPALIFLTMTPRFPRTRKFANPYALAGVDGVFCLLWLTAFAAQASYNSSGKCGGGCGKSKIVVAMGVIVWILWVLTTLISLYGVVYFKREGYLPGASRAPQNAQMIDPDKEAFSTAPHEDEYAPVHDTEDHELMGNDSRPPSYADGPLGSNPGAGSQSDRYDGGYSGGYVPPTVHDETTSYGGYSGSSTSAGTTGGRAQFPQARYGDV